MKIKIFAIAKKPQGWARDGENDFFQRISNFAKLELEFIQPLDENSLGAEKAKDLEGEKLFKKIDSDEFVIACDKEGKSFSSEDFAKTLGELKDSGRKICFLIGGSSGLSQRVLQRADLMISFSQFTFPHELFRVVLLEQIYRACMILAGKKYHK